MIDVTEKKQESISEMMNQGNSITDKDLNNFYYWFNQLLEASLFISYELDQDAERTGSMKQKIQAEGFDNVIKECHSNILKLKKKYEWDSNIGEEQQ